MSLFKRRDIDAYADSLADYMPGGVLFTAKSIQDSNFRKLLRGIAGELFEVNGLLREYSGEILPDQTSKFLDEWEMALGIPDDCFSGTGSLDERRRDVLVKLASLGVQTATDFIELAALFGIAVDVIPAIDEITFPLTFPIPMFDTEKDARFSIFVRFFDDQANSFPLTFPFTFGSGEIGILECLFGKIKPANVNLIFQQV